MSLAFQHLCDSLNLCADSLVALLTFYGDESGTESKTNVVVAGYVADMLAWKRFAIDWQSILDAEQVELLHRKNMEWPFHGEFKGWTLPRQKRVLRKAHYFIKKHTLKGVAESIKVRAFREIMPRRVKNTFGGCYGWGVRCCVIGLGKWAREHNHWIHYVFASGAPGSIKVHEALDQLHDSAEDRERYRIASWTFADMKGPHALIQLQAADFIAFEAYKQIDNRVVGGEKRPYRKSAHNLIRPKQDHMRFWSDRDIIGNLVKYCDNPEFVRSIIEDY